MSRTPFKTLIPSGDVMQMKQYVTGFWLERSASLAEAHARHVQHVDRIAYVNEAYGVARMAEEV